MKDTDACAAIVQRDDPRLFRTALFAPEHGRRRLMELYAFDIELSRATRASRESLIPRMRLQWWRDVVAEAEAGGEPKAHEVAGPLAGLVQEGVCSGGALSALIEAHESLLDLPWSDEDHRQWRERRFQALLDLAGAVLAGGAVAMPAAGPALADAFALRHAARMAADGGAVALPGLRGADLSALARGALTTAARDLVVGTARQGLCALDRARRDRADRRSVPALLPALWAERTCRLVLKEPAAIFGQLDDIDRPFDGLRFAWRAFRGRW